MACRARITPGNIYKKTKGDLPRAVPHEVVAREPVLQIVIIVNFVMAFSAEQIIWSCNYKTEPNIPYLLIAIPDQSTILLLFIIIDFQNSLLYTIKSYAPLNRSHLSSFSNVSPVTLAAFFAISNAFERLIAVGREERRKTAFSFTKASNASGEMYWSK